MLLCAGIWTCAWFVDNPWKLMLGLPSAFVFGFTMDMTARKAFNRPRRP